jgi:hypothetical protein
VGTFPHAVYSDAMSGIRTCTGSLAQGTHIKPSAPIADLEFNLTVPANHRHLCTSRLAVPTRVVQCLLDDPVRSHLNRRREPPTVKPVNNLNLPPEFITQVLDRQLKRCH